MDEFLRGQRRLICAQLGHYWVLPLHAEMRVVEGRLEVHGMCRTCENRGWVEILPEKREQFLKDLNLEPHVLAEMKKA